MLNRSKTLFAVILVSALFAAPLAAQVSSATILGTVNDSSGAAIADASVQVKNVGTGITQTTASNAQGRFTVPDLGNGDYEVQASKAGFARSCTSPFHPTTSSASTSAGPSTGGAGSKRQVVKQKKGRGFRTAQDDSRYQGKGGLFEAVEDDDSVETDAQKSGEGWIIAVTGIHEESQEDDIHEAFSEYGPIKQLHMNLDRRTGFVKGYALVEYKNYKEAQAAINAMDDTMLLEKKIHVDWAFKKPPKRGGASRRGRR